MSEQAFDSFLFWFLRIGMVLAAIGAVASLAWGFAYGWG